MKKRKGYVMKVWILLPAYNEEKSIELLFPKISKEFDKRDLVYKIVVVDDGSTDSTRNILKNLQAKYDVDVVNHKLNRGLGETERDGFEYVAEHAEDDDILVRMDCDDTHEPEYVFTLIDKLNNGFDVVNTSRFQPGGGQKGVTPYRAFVSYCANLFMKIVFNIQGIRDYSCGFRAYRVKVIKDAIRIFENGFIQLKGLGFTSTLETIVKLKLLGCRFAEVPFILRYDKKASPSKMVSSITTMGYFTMAILYHWPFGGWKSFYKNLAETYRHSPENAYNKFAISHVRKSAACKIGG
jgi:dolichol-phosphate mannosyltransferase